MSLKFPFKFKHKDSMKVYTAKLGEYSNVDVHWTEEYGIIEHAYYSLRYVAANIRSGIWVIIEEPSPVVSITQDEYDSMVEEINLLQDLLAEANSRIAELETQSKDCTPKFKPVKDMDYFDWMIACRKGYTFKTRDGNTTFVIEMDDESTHWPVRTDNGWYRLDGSFDSDGKETPEDIIERVS
jgi:hypothetical protein